MRKIYNVSQMTLLKLACYHTKEQDSILYQISKQDLTNRRYYVLFGGICSVTVKEKPIWPNSSYLFPGAPSSVAVHIQTYSNFFEH